jgi:hypothetical protein
MEKKSANQIIRQIIREEITRALRVELPKIISESIQQTKKEVVKKDTPPLTLNSSPMIRYEDVKFKNSNSTNPLASLLNETAMEMRNNDSAMHFSSEDVGPGMNPIMAFQPKEVAVGGVTDMLSTARPSSNIDAVQINVVPDYSQMMEKMGIS